MKKVTLIFVLLLTVGITVVAQTSGNEQKLLGTWVSADGKSTIVFNSNGTMLWDGDSMKYGAAVDKLVLFNDDNSTLFEFFISTDGRTLIITIGDWRERTALVFRKRN